MTPFIPGLFVGRFCSGIKFSFDPSFLNLQDTRTANEHLRQTRTDRQTVMGMEKGEKCKRKQMRYRIYDMKEYEYMVGVRLCIQHLMA